MTRSEFDEEIATALMTNRSILGGTTIDTDAAWIAYGATPQRWERTTQDNPTGSVGAAFILSDRDEPWWEPDGVTSL